jgi:hypothetical protein
MLGCCLDEILYALWQEIDIELALVWHCTDRTEPQPSTLIMEIDYLQRTWVPDHRVTRIK